MRDEQGETPLRCPLGPSFLRRLIDSGDAHGSFPIMTVKMMGSQSVALKVSGLEGRETS